MSIRNRLFWSVLALGIVAVLLCAHYAHSPFAMTAVILGASFACGLTRPRLFWVGGLSLGLAKLLFDLGWHMHGPVQHGVLEPIIEAMEPLFTYASIITAFRLSLIGSVLGALLGSFLESRAEQLAD